MTKKILCPPAYNVVVVYLLHDAIRYCAGANGRGRYCTIHYNNYFFQTIIIHNIVLITIRQTYILKCYSTILCYPSCLSCFKEIGFTAGRTRRRIVRLKLLSRQSIHIIIIIVANS